MIVNISGSSDEFALSFDEKEPDDDSKDVYLNKFGKLEDLWEFVRERAR